MELVRSSRSAGGCWLQSLDCEFFCGKGSSALAGERKLTSMTWRARLCAETSKQGPPPTNPNPGSPHYLNCMVPFLSFLSSFLPAAYHTVWYAQYRTPAGCNGEALAYIAVEFSLVSIHVILDTFPHWPWA